MKQLILASVCAVLMTSGAFAAEPCDAQAAAKNLHGAAKTSFAKKCEADALAAPAAACDEQATARKLAGAARTSFVKKCETDSQASSAAACEG